MRVKRGICIKISFPFYQQLRLVFVVVIIYSVRRKNDIHEKVTSNILLIAIMSDLANVKPKSQR